MNKLYLFLFLCFANISNLYADGIKNLDEAQAFQRQYDEKHFELNQGFEKLRHVFLHLAKSTGKMAAYCEVKEHGKEPNPSELLDEVLPDLLIHALQIANHFDIDLSEKYTERIQFLLNRAKARAN